MAFLALIVALTAVAVVLAGLLPTVSLMTDAERRIVVEVIPMPIGCAGL